MKRILLLAGVLLGACNTGPLDPDTGPPRPIDAGAPIDAPPPIAPPEPTQLFQTAGGGDADSPIYHLRLRIGAPQPMGRAQSPHYNAHLGPH